MLPKPKSIFSKLIIIHCFNDLDFVSRHIRCSVSEMTLYKERGLWRNGSRHSDPSRLDKVSHGANRSPKTVETTAYEFPEGRKLWLTNILGT